MEGLSSHGRLNSEDAALAGTALDLTGTQQIDLLEQLIVSQSIAEADRGVLGLIISGIES
jgi:hypothetical protein